MFSECEEGQECCDLVVGTEEFYECCNLHGCCPMCPCPTCASTRKCKKQKGVCKITSDCDDDEVEIRRGCRGTGCKCCAKAEVVPDCEGALACCGIEPGTGDFFECVKDYHCVPICPPTGCCYGNTTVDFGAVIADYPEKCLKLTCQMQNITEAPYIAGAIVEDSVDNCSCCSLGGELYENGHLLTDDDHCIAVRCVDGQWTNENYMNGDCRSCFVQDPLETVATFDGTAYTHSDPDCSYSLVQDGLGSNPDSYIGIDIQPGALDGQYTHETLIFKDDGAEAVTCPADDPVNGCSFGAVTADPTEIGSSGTLAFTYMIGSLQFTALMGSNGITTLYSQNSLLVLASTSRQDELYGLCGAFDGDGTNDFTTSDGVVTTDTAEFTQSYQIDCPAGRAHSIRMHSHKPMPDECADETDEDMQMYKDHCHSLMAPMQEIAPTPMPMHPSRKCMCVSFMCRCTDDHETELCFTSMEKIQEMAEEIAERSFSPDEIKQLINEGASLAT